MALIGSSNVAEGNGATLTTSNVTSTADSLVVGGCANWHATDPQNCGVTSSLAGTYTEAAQHGIEGTEDITYSITYNRGGTRGANHQLTALTSSVARSVSWQEFDSIAASPTVTTGSEASGSSTAPSCSVTASVKSTVVGIMTYGGASTTATVSDGDQISEADEDSTQQAHFVAAKYGVTGATTIAWTLADTRSWSCYAVAFEEVVLFPEYEQEGFRFFADDGDEDSSTGLANQDTSITRATLANARLRILTDEKNVLNPPSTRVKFRYRKVGDDGLRDLKPA